MRCGGNPAVMSKRTAFLNLNLSLLPKLPSHSAQYDSVQCYPGMILGVRKNSNSCAWMEMVVRLNRFPISGKLPTIGVC
jgi:hypothetical protein